MKEYVSTISSKGQVTIPADVRRELGVETADKVIFVIAEDGAVELRRAPYRVADLRGIVPALPNRETVDFDDLIAEAFAERVDE
jgi:AbrB family looped-hinge helix DNA binding protein